MSEEPKEVHKYTCLIIALDVSPPKRGSKKHGGFQGYIELSVPVLSDTAKTPKQALIQALTKIFQEGGVFSGDENVCVFWPYTTFRKVMIARKGWKHGTEGSPGKVLRMSSSGKTFSAKRGAGEEEG